MRKTIWIAIASSALLAGACKKKDESAREMDRAAVSASKAQENVDDQVKDVQSAQKDVTKDQQTVTKDQADLNKQQGELDSAKADLAAARDRFRDAAKQRLAKIDDEIHQLEARSESTAKDVAAKLRVERDEIATKLDAIGNQLQDGWGAFKKDVDARFDKAESEARDALGKDT